MIPVMLVARIPGNLYFLWTCHQEAFLLHQVLDTSFYATDGSPRLVEKENLLIRIEYFFIDWAKGLTMTASSK